MPTTTLPPPPVNDKPGSFAWLEWYRQLRAYVSTSGSVPWYIINFAGSNITDIALRDHNQLQNVQGGSSNEKYHLTQAQHGNLTSTEPEFSSIVLSNIAGNGIKLDHSLPAYGWKDLLGDTVPKATGVGSPTLTAFRSDVMWFAYTTNEFCDLVYHIPHDYVPGTDLFLHVHWAHVGTSISGDMDLRFHLSYAKGHGQAAFPADVEPHLTVTSLNITDVPQYQHELTEIQISASSPSATQLDTDVIEPDGLILVHYNMDTLPTISGGTTNKVFIFAVDLHYQATNITTKNKSPDFYT